MVSEDWRWKEKAPGMKSFYRSRVFYHVSSSHAKFIGTKGSVYIKNGVELLQDWLIDQHVGRFIVLQHQSGCHTSSNAYMLKFTIILNLITKELKTLDISTYSVPFFFDKIFLTDTVSFTLA